MGAGGFERREYDVVLVPEAEGSFSVSVPDLPSVATQGETVEEALDMARDAVELREMFPVLDACS